MRLHLFADGYDFRAQMRLRVSAGTFGGGSGAEAAEDVFENPLAARDRRGSGRDRRHEQNAALAQQSAARIVRQLSPGGNGCRRRPGMP